MEIFQTLEHILNQIKQDSFGGREAPVTSLKDGTHVDDGGNLQGALLVHIKRRSGEIALLHEQTLDGIRDETALKDAFANSLSIVLSNHSKWPR